ncbi:MAG: protein kinase domain-containing protein [Phormidesmis sp.]
MLINNRYQVVRTLGEGGFGHAYLADDVQMPSRRRCVIKQLKPLTTKPEIYQVVQARFQREAAILERLGEDHKQIPRLYAYFSENQRFYLVQEWIEGTTLEALVAQQGALSEAAVRSILAALLPVLDFIHTQGIIHRDLKPHKIILRADTQQPVLIDCGAVRETMGTVVSSYNSPRSSIVIGTPGFMPSEQAAGRPIPSSDLYSLGLTAIFLLTRQLPQSLDSDPQTGELIWRPVAGHVSSGLVDVIDRAVRSHPRDRYSNASQMLAALSALPGAVAPPSQLPIIPVNPISAPAKPPARDQASTLKTVVVSPAQAAPAQSPYSQTTPTQTGPTQTGPTNRDPSTYQQAMEPTQVGGADNNSQSQSGRKGLSPILLGLLVAVVSLGAIAGGFFLTRTGEETTDSARIQPADRPARPSDREDQEEAADSQEREEENSSDDATDSEEIPEESLPATSDARSGEQITLSSSSSNQIALYDSPSFAASSSGSGVSGDRATILRQSQGDDGATWYYVRYDSGAEGWVSSAYASSGSAAPPAPEPAPEPAAPTQQPAPAPAPTQPAEPTPTPTPTPQLEGGSPGDQVDVHSAPSSSSNSPHYGLVGDRVTVLNTAKGDDGRMWAQVQFASGARGWVSSDTVRMP